MCKEIPRVFTEREIRGKVFKEIYKSLQHKICKENPRVFTERKIRGKVFQEICSTNISSTIYVKKILEFFTERKIRGNVL
jgi:hypothetical protein